MSSAIIVGAAGQDGRLLAAHLRAQDVEVIEVTRTSHDVCDTAAMKRLIAEARPRYLFYLAAKHGSSEDRFSPALHDLLRESWRVHVDGTSNLLAAVAEVSPATRVFYAASSLVFGTPAESPQNELTPMRPGEAYGITKLAGMNVCRLYREKAGVFASCGILYNHESPLRGANYVTQRIARGVALIKAGREKVLRLRSLDAAVDWSHAADFARAMQAVLDAEPADDFVFASGTSHTVGGFAERAFAHVGLDWRDFVHAEGAAPSGGAVAGAAKVGDCSKLRRVTGWRPTVSFEALVAEMVDAQLKAVHETV